MITYTLSNIQKVSEQNIDTKIGKSHIEKSICA
jgi:hypothetical protein